MRGDIVSPEGEDDRELHDGMIAEDFKGARTEACCGWISAYAISVLRRCIASGEIYAKAGKALRKNISWGRREQDRHRVNELAQAICEKAWEKFVRDTRAGIGWDPDGDLSLRGYFLTVCYYCALNVIDQSRGHKADRNAVTTGSEFFEWRRSEHVDRWADELQILDSWLVGEPYRRRQIAVMLAMGFTKREVAKALNTSTSTVCRELAILRKSIRRKKEEGSCE